MSVEEDERTVQPRPPKNVVCKSFDFSTDLRSWRTNPGIVPLHVEPVLQLTFALSGYRLFCEMLHRDGIPAKALSRNALQSLPMVPMISRTWGSENLCRLPPEAPNHSNYLLPPQFSSIGDANAMLLRMILARMALPIESHDKRQNF
ncbi:MAG: hypothetical protein Q9190_004413 [Brigantiaea leucoxantha]